MEFLGQETGDISLETGPAFAKDGHSVQGDIYRALGRRLDLLLQ